MQDSGYITAVDTQTTRNSRWLDLQITVSEFQRWIRRSLSKRQHTPNLPILDAHTPSTSSPPHQPTPKCNFLHVCIEKGRYSTRLHHIDMCKRTTDRAVFNTLRKDYQEIRRELNSILFKINRIDFVEVSFGRVPKCFDLKFQNSFRYIPRRWSIH